MKIKRLVKLAFLLINIFLFPVVGYTVGNDMMWESTLHAKGADIGGLSVYQVTIGIGTDAQAFPAPPSAPMYSVKMDLVSNIDGELLSKEIHANNSSKKYSWTLSIDPHGNIFQDTYRSSTISWNSEDFATSNCVLRQGRNDMGGKIIVENMSTTSSLSVDGGGRQQFFTIECFY